MIVQRFYQPGPTGRYHIDKAENGRFFVEYGVKYDETRRAFVWDCIAGPFDNEREAYYALKRHRPGCVRLNAMCGNCTRNDCNGTAMEYYTGCAMKQEEV